MGAETDLEPGHDANAHTHVVQATDASGRVVSRDPVDTPDVADARAAEPMPQGRAVDVSRLQLLPSGRD